MNKLFAIGRLTADPQVKDVKETKLCAFVLAVPKTKDEADFLRCVAFGKTAEVIGQYVKKGSKIAIEGALHTRTYETKEGEKGYSWEIMVNAIDFMDSKPNEGNKKVAKKKEEPEEENSLPFDFPM